ncbi:MAG: hypothetical protein ACLPVW_07325 [Terriglobales bacterium]
MSKLAVADFMGKSGKTYQFEVHAWGSEFEAVGAVYAITKRSVTNGNGSHIFIYFGQTGNLSERFEGHEKADCFTRNGANCICVHFESDEELRLAIEADFLEGYGTPCNE